METSDGTYLSVRWHQFCEGDRDAFAEIAEGQYALLHHYGTRFTADKDLIKDCLQDLFLDIWEKRERLIDVHAVKPYLFKALRNNLLRKVRRQAMFSGIGDDEPTQFNDLSPESEWIHAESSAIMNERLHHAMAQLPRRQREALYLKYFSNLSYEEIAQVMGLQRQAVANYLQYGIQKLREACKNS